MKQVDDFIGQHTRFTRSGTGDDKLRSAAVFHGGTLLGIELVEIVVFHVIWQMEL